MEFVEAGNPDRAAEQVLQPGLATDVIDPLAHGGGYLAEPGVEDVEDRFAGGLDDAFFKTFDEAFLAAFLKGEFFEEGDVRHGFGG